MLPVGDAAGDPFAEEVAAPGQFGGADDAAGLAGAGSDEEDETAAFGYAADDFAGAAEVGGCHVQADDVDRVLFAADAEDVLGVGGMPEACGMADVRLAGEEQFEGDVLG